MKKTPKWLRVCFEDLSNSMELARVMYKIEIIIKNTQWRVIKQELNIKELGI